MPPTDRIAGGDRQADLPAVDSRHSEQTPRALHWSTRQARGDERSDETMAYDLLIKNGRIIDGSGRPGYHGDVGVVRGKIAELGRLDGHARRVIEADGRVVAPW